MVVIILGAGFANTVAEADWDVWATEVAVTVTVRLLASAVGAVYVALVADTPENVPHESPEHPGPVAVHLTP